MGFAEQKERDAQAHSARDKELERRRKQTIEDDKPRQEAIAREVELIRQQAANRKKGSWF